VLGGTASGNLVTGNILDAADYPSNVNAKPLTVIKSSSSIWTLSGTNTYSGTTTISGGTLEIGGAGLLGGGNYTNAISVASGATLWYNSSADQMISGVLSNAGNVVKAGAGTLTLTGTKTYTGATTVSNGTLKVNGALTGSGSPVSVFGGTLSGTGSIARAVAVTSGTLQPGDLTGTLTISSNLTVGAGATNQFAVGTNGAQVAVTGNLSLAGTLNITDAGGLGAGTNTLFSYTGALTYTPVAIGVTPNPAYSYTVDTNTAGQVNLVVANLIPTPTGLTALGLNAKVQLSWNAVTNADSYYLYRSASSNGSYTATYPVAATSYTDTNVVNGTPYWYAVQSTNSLGASALSAWVTATPAVPAAPAFAGGVLSLGAGQATLTFTTQNGYEYRLLYNDDLLNTNGWTAVVPPTPDGWTNGAGSNLSITDTNAGSATQRFYKVEVR